MKSHAWEQRKAKDLFAAYSDKGHPDLDVLSATQDRGMVRRDDNNINISHDKKNEATYKRVLPGQFVIHLRSFQGGFAYSSIEGITSPAYTVFGFSKPQEHEPNFWKFVFSSEQFIKRLEKVTYGIRDGRSISYDEVLTLSFTFPGKNEQIQIAHFLDKVGALITLHQRKYEKLLNIKKSMLEKMFPKEGEVVPEIRFKGFTGAWEQRKLGDVLEFLKDGTHGTHPDADQGSLLLSAKNIKNGDVTWDDTDRKISQAEFDMIHSNFKLKKGDVLLTIVGSIGESAILKDPHEITFQRSVAFLRPNKTITSGFLYSEIQGEKFQTELNNRKSTSAQPGIYLGDLSEIPLDTPPNLKEQEEIGKFFSEINSLLTLHQRKLEMLKNVKQAFLEKMFV